MDLDLRHLSNGVYLVKLRAQDFTAMQRPVGQKQYVRPSPAKAAPGRPGFAGRAPSLTPASGWPVVPRGIRTPPGPDGTGLGKISATLAHVPPFPSNRGTDSACRRGIQSADPVMEN